MYENCVCTKCGCKLDTGMSCSNPECNKEQNFNITQHTKIANCHLWREGGYCSYVREWVCQSQCCVIPQISNRL